MNEKTLVILKPDALRRKLVGEIISRFERLGLDLVAVKMITFTEELCREHYAHLAGEDFPENCGVYDFRSQPGDGFERPAGSGFCPAAGGGDRPAGGRARYHPG